MFRSETLTFGSTPRRKVTPRVFAVALDRLTPHQLGAWSWPCVRSRQAVELQNRRVTIQWRELSTESMA